MSIQNAIVLANERWPNLTFTIKNGDEACSPCPWCGGEDRFSIFAENNYVCFPRQSENCGRKGWILENQQEKMTDLERRVLANEAKIARLEREQKEHALQLKAIETMLICTAHIKYHETMPESARDYWHSEGITDDSITKWKLGYTQHIPLWQSREGYTIPIINNGKLRNIRYRAKDDRKPKYLPHMKHLPPTLFNADRLIKPQDRSMIILSEGEKKCMSGEQQGFPAVGVLGTNAFDKKWIKWFMQFQRVYVCLDSDAIDKAVALAKLFGLKGRMIELPQPGKLDDCFNAGMTRRDFCELIRKARMP